MTKTAFLRFLKCPPEFWLEYHQPLLAGAEPITLEHEHFRQQGYEVERAVKQMRRFAGDAGTLVEFQRVFQSAKLWARSDIALTDNATGEIDIYEVKSSGSVKPEHHEDVSFQKVTAEAMGFTVRKCYVVVLNTEYIRRGEIDVEQLFTVSDVTDTVNQLATSTKKRIDDAFAYLDSVPVSSLAEYCVENKLDCSFVKLHFPGLPDYTVFDISYLHHDKRRQLLGDGVIDIIDVPDGFKLSKKQRSQVEVAKAGTPIIDREKIAERIGQWQYPLHFLDYETFQYAIPQFEGIRPFQQMCFQYSLHTIDSPGASPRHSEYLSQGDDLEPPRRLADRLKADMGDEIGTVFVWFEKFEKTRNDEMAVMFPDLAEFFNEVNEKTFDLMKIFSDDLYIHPDFKGKTSIKKVLPVLVPSLSYDSLGIKEGMAATIKWYRAVKWPSLSETERLQIFSDLKEYCELDSLAMVEIFYKLVALESAGLLKD